ncbi:CopD family protein [Neobacillus sp. YX16]|uniref:copper resistance D family protein n=1 Tax=Neobacillus sp. YX16 TaxID=3047874 RepID=UPI0024C3189E|nr:CopD family protein [Neobacillus sp. YX16]WHZ05433.1 CopD family protein [Neobacillus sp. YX16]
MNLLSSIAELGNYLLFSILVGYVVLQFVSDSQKPSIQLPKPLLLICTLGIILFTFVPVFTLILLFDESVGFVAAAASVLTRFQIGQGWLFNTVFTIFLWLTLYLNRSKYLQAFWIVLMIITIGYSSHVSTQSFVVGLFSHTTHFLMVTIWVGVVLQVSWFSKDKEHWSEFLQWFSPLAVVCMINIFATGFVIMFTLEKPAEYVNGWATPYGRMLLFKHISIVPIIMFAFINGILTKRVSTASKYDPRNWLKAESVILLLVFFFTAVMGTLSPPYEMVYAAQEGTAPTWVDWLLAKNLLVPIEIEFSPTFLSIILVSTALLFLLLIFVSYKSMSPVFATVFGGCFILTLYLGLMFSCVLYPII